MARIHWIDRVCWQRTFMLTAIALLLNACTAYTGHSSWISAPLVADGGVQGAGGLYRAYDERLSVGQFDRAELKFSLATLPNGVLGKMVIENNTATIGSENYALTPDKIFRARLSVFVDSVTEPGYLHVDGAYALGGDCFANESVQPFCTQTVNGTTIAADGDNPAQSLRITQEGYYAFDVTDLVKDRLASGYDGILRISSPADPDSGIHGQFEIASKETLMLKSEHHHQPELLITLTDMIGTESPIRTTSVQNILSNPAIANRDFRLDNNQIMNGLPEERAYALYNLPTLNFGTSAFSNQYIFNLIGTRSYKLSLTAQVNSAIPTSPTNPSPMIEWYRIPAFNSGSNPITWNNGWSEPGPGAQLATTSIASDRSMQTITSDLSSGFLNALAESYVYAAPERPSFAVAGTTNVQGAVFLDGAETGQGHAPRISLVASRTSVELSEFDTNDNTFDVVPCLREHIDDPNTCRRSATFRARIGQKFLTGLYLIDPVDLNHALVDGTYVFVTPINISFPPSTSGIELTSDQDPPPATQMLPTYGVLGAPTGYLPPQGRANRVVGSYTASISMPGHNARSEIRYENLPLPSVTLSGPARVAIPAGSSSVAIPVDAAVPFVLHVADPIVNANIDDTTKWLFSSSEPSDTMPSETQKTDGQINLAMSFGSAGPRTITVKSKGDNTITATLDVIVDLQSTIALDAQGTIPVVGQPFNLVAMVTDHGGEAITGGTVEFHAGATLLGNSDIVGGMATLSLSMPAAGVYLFTASYAGDDDSHVAGSVSSDEAFAVDQALTSITIATPAPVFVNDPVAVSAALGVVAPGAGAPSGMMTISDGVVSCAFDVTESGGCTLSPTSAGTHALTASYGGDMNFFGTSAVSSLSVLDRPVLAASVDDGGGYAHYGRVIDYVVTVRNDGLGEARAFPIDATLSAAFEGAFAHWQCFGAGAGANCAASGAGPLHDVATIPPGRSLTWLISVPVLYGTAESEAVLTIDIGGVDPHQIVSITKLVILRDGFDDPYGAGSQVIEGDDADSILAGEHMKVFALPPRTDQGIDNVLALRSGDREVRVQRAWLDSATALIRLSLHQASGAARATAWVRSNPAATLAIEGLGAEDGSVQLILVGAEAPAMIVLDPAESR